MIEDRSAMAKTGRAADPAIDRVAEDALIARYIRERADSARSDEARVVGDGGGPEVWVIVSALRGGDVAAVARDFDLPEEAVVAARAYYARHRALIDARLLLQDASFG